MKTEELAVYIFVPVRHVHPTTFFVTRKVVMFDKRRIYILCEDMLRTNLPKNI